MMEEIFLKILYKIIARFYLKKPDLEEFLYIKFPTLKSAFKMAINEICFVLKFPWSPFLTGINIEITNFCNLKCKMCPVGNGEMKRKQGYMSFEDFKKIIDEAYKYTNLLLPFQWGEPLIHPQIWKMIKYAVSKKMRVMLTTNGTLLNSHTIPLIVNSGLERITVSVDGVGSTYENIRGFSYSKLKENIKLLKDTRDKLNPKLKIDVSMVVYEDTQDQYKEYIKEWKDLCDRIQFIPRFVKNKRTTRCRELWRGVPVIFWDKKIGVCCADYNAKMIIGEFRENTSLLKVWNNKKMRYLRKLHNKKIFPSICRYCSEYNTKIASKRFS